MLYLRTIGSIWQMPGRPDKADGNKNDCMEGVLQNGQILSNDINCSEERMFVCEKPKNNH